MKDAVPGETRIPLMAEEATVSTREVDVEHLRVRTVMEEHVSNVHATVARQHLDVTRRKVERPVSTPPEPYEEGDMLVVPIVEERLVIEKRLFVTEELLVRRETRHEEVHLPTKLRAMRAVVERDGNPSASIE